MATAPAMEGVRVLDLAGAIGAYVGKLLADLGADVVKVEPLGGDPMRCLGPFKGGVAGPERSLLFAYYNRNKRGVTLDVYRPEGDALLRQLAAGVDVVLVAPDERTGSVVGFEAGTASVVEGGPWDREGLIVCAMSPFGLTGPHRTWQSTPLTTFAASGSMYPVGEPDAAPLGMPGRQAYDEAGAHAALAVAAALLVVPEVGGQVIDLSVHEVIAMQDRHLDRFQMGGFILTRQNAFYAPPSGVWQCADGHVDIAAHSERHWQAFLEMTGHPDELLDDLYATRNARAELWEVLVALITPLMAPFEVQDFVRRGQRIGLPCAVFNTPSSFLQDPQPRARGVFEATDHPAIGPMEMPRSPFVASPPLITSRYEAPLLGQHNDEVYGELGHTAAAIAAWRQQGVI